MVITSNVRYITCLIFISVLHLDGLGYHDDGEEHYHDDEPSDMRRADTSAIAITANALKKARKDKALLQASKDSADGDGDGATGKNRSMWEFVQSGPVPKAAPSTSNVSNSMAVNKSSSLSRASVPSGGHNFDSLLDQLDQVGHLPPVAKRRRVVHGSLPKPQYSKSSAHVSLSRSSNVRSSTQSVHLSSRHRASQQPTTNHDEQDDDMQDSFDFNNFDAGDDDYEGTTDNAPDSRGGNTDAEDLKTVIHDRNRHATAPTKGDNVYQPTSSTAAEDDSKSEKEEPSHEADIPVNARKRLIASSRQYRVPAVSKPPEEPNSLVENTDNETSKSPPAANLPSNIDLNSSSFKPDTIAVDDAVAVATSSALAANLESIIQMDEISSGSAENAVNQRNYVDLFWLDIQEKNGNILLFGKVEAPRPIDASGQDLSKQFISCCAVVKNNQRSLFVLPRLKEDGSGEYESMQDVHAEM